MSAMDVDGQFRGDSALVVLPVLVLELIVMLFMALWMELPMVVFKEVFIVPLALGTFK